MSWKRNTETKKMFALNLIWLFRRLLWINHDESSFLNETAEKCVLSHLINPNNLITDIEQCVTKKELMGLTHYCLDNGFNSTIMTVNTHINIHTYIPGVLDLRWSFDPAVQCNLTSTVSRNSNTVHFII